MVPHDDAFPDFTYRALLVDAAGTLLIPSEPAAEVVPGVCLCFCMALATLALKALQLQVYLRFGGKYGVKFTAEEVLTRFRR